MSVIIWTAVGTLAAVLTSFGFGTLVMKMWRSKSVGDVGVTTFLQSPRE